MYKWIIKKIITFPRFLISANVVKDFGEKIPESNIAFVAKTRAELKISVLIQVSAPSQH
jgi:hypothetical protein